MTCPCKTKLTDEQKELINSQNGKPFVNNTSATGASGASSALTTTVNRLATLSSIFTSPLPADQATATALSAAGVNASKISQLSTKVGTLKSSVDTFKNQAQALTNPQTLMAVVGKMTFAANLGCALGIEGLDVNLSVGIIGGKGINSINIAGGVNVDVNKILDNIALDSNGAILNNGAQNFLAGLESVTSKIDSAVSAVDGVVNDSLTSIANASSLITNYSQINFFSNLLGGSGDPCNNASVAFATDSILTDDFKQLAGAANSSITQSTTTGGGFTR
jgi:outer membrane murein-binding lipoprotein Lpp